MTDGFPPEERMWTGKYLEVKRRGRWEYAGRTNDVHAVVIVARDEEGHVFLVSQPRQPLGAMCLELPAGLVGDEGEHEEVSRAAGRELEEEIGYRGGARRYRAGRIAVVGEFASSPGMTSETFTLVIASELDKVSEGGGLEGEDITVHRVSLPDVPRFVEEKRAEGMMVDAKLLLLLAGGLLG